MNQLTTDDVPAADPVDALDALRAEGNAPPRRWGFLRETEREAELRRLVEQSLAAQKPLPAWALRECQRLQIRVRPHNAATSSH